MIFCQKWQFRLENENFEISRNSSYDWTMHICSQVFPRFLRFPRFKMEHGTECDLSNDLCHVISLLCTKIFLIQLYEWLSWENSCSRTLRSMWLDKNGMEPVSNNQRMQYFQPTDVLLQSTQVFTSFLLINCDGTHPVFHFFHFISWGNEIWSKWFRLRNYTCGYNPSSLS